MDNALETIIKSAAGTGAPTTPNSRYYGSPVLSHTDNSGLALVYLPRRLIPQPEIYPTTFDYLVVQGDRLDNLAAKYLGDPLLYWMICDANASAFSPDDLTAQIGRTIRIPIISAIPAGMRYG
ncbi:MAG: LysM domain-containing protein [Methylococcales bacterium]|jgi:hypothetical protein